MKRQIKWLLLGGVPILCLVLYLFTMAPQDRKLREHKKTFLEIRHPEGTALVSTHNHLGTLDPIRVMYKDTFEQGCDYLVGEVRKYPGTKERIQAFYAAQKLRERIPISTMFVPVNSNGLPDADALTREEAIAIGPGGVYIMDFLHGEYVTALPKQRYLETSGNYYFVFIMRQEFEREFPSAGLDLRCN